MSYKVKRDCKNHAPFPKSMCAHCIPPSITLKRQAYRHIDFCRYLINNSQQYNYKNLKISYLFIHLILILQII